MATNNQPQTTAVSQLRDGNANIEKLFMAPERISRVKQLLPKHLDPEGYMRTAVNAVLANPRLKECTPASLVESVMKAVDLGLYINGPQGHAYLIPYKKIATLQIGYQGWIELCYRTGKIDTISGYAVGENDIFDYGLGEKPFVKHKPSLDDPGNSIAYYTVIWLKGSDRPVISIMGRGAVEKHRNTYSQAWKNDSNTPWKTDFDAMALKTTFLQGKKWLPKSKEFLELDKAVAIDVAGSRQLDPAAVGLVDYTDVTAQESPDSTLDPVSEALEAKQAARASQKAQGSPTEAPVEPQEPATEVQATLVDFPDAEEPYDRYGMEG